MRLDIAAAAVLLAAASSAAQAAADGRPTIGSAAPLPVMRDVAGHARPMKDAIGRRGMVVLFWAGWSDRSIEELRRLDAAASELGAHGVTIAAVNVDRFSVDEAGAAELRAQIDRLQLRVPVLVDRGLELFHAYGVVTVPSTAVLDDRGRLSYFLYGYSHEQREALFDAIDHVAGIARQRPAAPPATVAPAALRRLQLGRLQLQQGHVEPARSSFEVAVQADAAFADPLVELAALALDASDVNASRALLDRAAALNPRHVAMRRERARLAAIDAAGDHAGDAQERLVELAADGDAASAAYLGYLLWARGDAAGSEAAFDRARSISDVDPRSYLAATERSAAAAARAMTRYRREVASAVR